MSDFIVVETTTDSRELADQIADKMIESHAAACVQISGPIQSIYRWKGKVQRDQEFTLTLKTRRNLFDTAAGIIRDLHSYDEPQIVAFEIVDGAKSYLNWIETETAQEKSDQDP